MNSLFKLSHNKQFKTAMNKTFEQFQNMTTEEFFALARKHSPDSSSRDASSISKSDIVIQ